MAFPQIVSITNSSRSSSSANDVVTLPTTASGDLLIVIHCAENHGGSTINEGFTEIKDAAGAGPERVLVAYKIATGTDNDPTVSKDTSERFSAQVIRISAASWHGTTPPEISTGATGSPVPNINPDPDSLTASWGAEDNLWIASFCMDENESTAPLPTVSFSLPDNQTDGNSPFSSAISAISSDELAQATLDPGTYTMQTGSNDTWIGFTIAVRPAAAGGAAVAGTHYYHHYYRSVVTGIR